jgi:hypothetical protein
LRRRHSVEQVARVDAAAQLRKTRSRSASVGSERTDRRGSRLVTTTCRRRQLLRRIGDRKNTNSCRYEGGARRVGEALLYLYLIILII